MTDEVVCIGCGCSDLDACESGCRWVRIDEDAGAGVCSNCPEFVECFDAGEYGDLETPARPPGGLILPGDPDFHL